jgi:hypothetical protein
MRWFNDMESNYKIESTNSITIPVTFTSTENKVPSSTLRNL